MTLKGMLDNLSLRDLEWWNQAPNFIDAFIQRVLNPRNLLHPLATFVKKLMNKTVDEWRLIAKKGTHRTRIKVDRTVPPSPTKSSSSDEFLFQAHCEIKHANTHDINHKIKGEKHAIPITFIKALSCG